MNLNDATAEELERTGQLDGISARQLVEHRALNGGSFSAWREVAEVPNFDEATVERLRAAGYRLSPDENAAPE